MTEYEILKSSASMLRMMEENGVDLKDVAHLEMYEEYRRLRNEGHKISYITYYLSGQYGCGQATVYRVVKRMEKQLLL